MLEEARLRPPVNLPAPAERADAVCVWEFVARVPTELLSGRAIQRLRSAPPERPSAGGVVDGSPRPGALAGVPRSESSLSKWVMRWVTSGASKIL